MSQEINDKLHSLDKRVTILEEQQKFTSEKITDAESVINKLVDKVDEHMKVTTSSNETLKVNLTEVTHAVTTLSSNMCEINGTLKSLANTAVDSKMKLSRLETIGRVISKTAMVLTVVIGAMWAVFTFVVEHDFFNLQQHVEKDSKDGKSN